jgi:leucyl aminopeptidase
VFEGAALAGPAAEADSAAGGALTRGVASGRFKGAKGQTLDLIAPAGLAVGRLLAFGLGEAEKLDDLAIEQGAAAAFAAVKASGLETLTLDLGGLTPAQAARAAFGVALAAYRFDKYRTTEKPDKTPSITTVQVAVDDVEAAEAAFAPLKALAEAIAFSRDLVSEPANVLYPAEFAARVKALEPLGLKVEILGERELEALGMGSLLCVGLGSARESQLAVIQWLGADDPEAQPVAFVGKGVCFDTGGISLKPAEGMEDMKWDMGGAGAVAGLMHVLAGRKAKVNAIGILGLVENMPDGKATRPGDIVTSMSGQTIEVINTDDAGLYANDDPLAEGLLAASKAEGENLWRMPLPSQYERQIESMAADMKNIGGRPGGSITAALFLQKFVKDTPWAHLDIASTAWKKPSTNPTIPEGATGFGVRLLNRLVADGFEG